nr:hypothetical protein [Tanacetum cinerariifolium]
GSGAAAAWSGRLGWGQRRHGGDGWVSWVEGVAGQRVHGGGRGQGRGEGGGRGVGASWGAVAESVGGGGGGMMGMVGSGAGARMGEGRCGLGQRYEHVVMTCGSAGNRISIMSKALLIPKYQDYQTQNVFITETSQSRQHDKSEPLAEYIDTLGWNLPAFYNNGDDDDEDCTIAITSDFLITDSLSMGDKHLDTIPEKESDEFNKSSVEDLVPNPSEFEDECECDVPDCDDSQMTNFSTFSNPLFDDSTSSDDESSHEEVIQKMSLKTYSNPLFDLEEEIISSKFNPIHNEDLDSTPKNDRFDTDSYPLESSLNHDTLMIFSLKIDSLLAEFSGELIFLESIPSGVDEANCDLEEDIHLLERLLYDNSSPRPPKKIVSENSYAKIESFSPPPIPVEDSGSHMEEIDLFLTLDDR